MPHNLEHVATLPCEIFVTYLTKTSQQPGFCAVQYLQLWYSKLQLDNCFSLFFFLNEWSSNSIDRFTITDSDVKFYEILLAFMKISWKFSTKLLLKLFMIDRG